MVQKEPVRSVADIPGDEKRSKGYLDSLPVEKARSIRWILFTAGRHAQYDAHAIGEYLRRLPNVDFLEVRSEAGDIIGFLPSRIVRKADGEPHYERLETFVGAVESGELSRAFPGSAITLRVRSNQSLVEVLKKMRSERVELAAVISDEGHYLGVVLAREVERRIANSVLQAN